MVTGKDSEITEVRGVEVCAGVVEQDLDQRQRAISRGKIE